MAERSLWFGRPLDNPKPDAVFGLHVVHSCSATPLSSGPFMGAATDHHRRAGRQTHGALPWKVSIRSPSRRRSSPGSRPSSPPDGFSPPDQHGYDRQHPGRRAGNIIPEASSCWARSGRSTRQRDATSATGVIRTAQMIAQSAGATADVNVELRYPVTVNDPPSRPRCCPVLRRVVGDTGSSKPVVTGSEDFHFTASARLRCTSIWV